ncbi:MAG: Rrf2 family transcriptional regulator [Myxococcota bacterium]
MRLTQFTDYGLRVLMYVASREGEFVPTERIATIFAISQDHLLKVVRRLVELGYVEAKRGARGGVRLQPAARTATVGEVIRNLEPQLLVECFDPEVNQCPIAEFCGLSSLLRRAGAAFYRELDRVSIGELMPSAALRKGWPPIDSDSKKSRRSR